MFDSELMVERGKFRSGRWVQAAIQLAGAAYSAYQASKGQQNANSSEQSFNATEADKQRIWEEQMYRHRYQYQREDLEKAGYNPILALGGAPAAPSGAAAVAHPRNERAQAAATLSNSARSVADVYLTRELANTEKSKQELNRAQADLARGSIGFFGTKVPTSALKAPAQQLSNAHRASLASGALAGPAAYQAAFSQWVNQRSNSK